jgi:hypothetical protein
MLKYEYLLGFDYFIPSAMFFEATNEVLSDEQPTMDGFLSSNFAAEKTNSALLTELVWLYSFVVW